MTLVNYIRTGKKSLHRTQLWDLFTEHVRGWCDPIRQQTHQVTSHAAEQPQSVSANKLAENMLTKHFCHFKMFPGNSFISMKYLYVNQIPLCRWNSPGKKKQNCQHPSSVSLVIHRSSTLLAARLTSQYSTSFRLRLSTDNLRKFLYRYIK